jgi:phage baseplate assembly protein W
MRPAGTGMRPRVAGRLMLAAILARWRPRVKLGEISAANRREGECAIGARASG